MVGMSAGVRKSKELKVVQLIRAAIVCCGLDTLSLAH